MLNLETDGELVETLNAVAEGFSGIRMLYTALILLGCIVVSRILLAILERSLKRFKVEKSLHTFVKSSAKILLGFLTIVLVGDYIGIPMTSLIAVFSVVGLALSLSIQGTLSNLAGGIMVLVSKPFAVGDYITAGEVSGTVADIGMAYTRISTTDNKIIFVPNGLIAAEKIVNFTSESKRRVDLKFDIAYESDPEVAKKAIRTVIDRHPMAFEEPEPFVRVMAYGESSVGITVRIWCKTQDYWTLYADMMEEVRVEFDKHGVELTYNHINVHMVKE